MRKSTGFPRRDELEEAIIEALTRMNGRATVTDINKLVIEILSLPDEIVQLEDESGLGTKLDYRLRWCRTNLKNAGEITNIERGTWELLK